MASHRRNRMKDLNAELPRAMLIAGALTAATSLAVLVTANLTAAEATGAAIELRTAERGGDADRRWTPPEGDWVATAPGGAAPQVAAWQIGDDQAAVLVLAQLLRQRYGAQ